MDPISQGVLGASFAQAAAKNKEKIIAAAWFGALAGMAPDLDVVIQSPSDPLLFLEFHRQFTHALIFIPLGALLVALPLFKLQVRFFSRICRCGKATCFVCWAMPPMACWMRVLPTAHSCSGHLAMSVLRGITSRSLTRCLLCHCWF